MIVGISGATGTVYAVRLLESLRDLGIETHLVVTRAAEMTAAYECDRPVREIKALASVVHPVGNVGASIASGSFKTMGMIVAPASMRTVGEIASGASTNLLTRAADVCLKERRRLVLMARETPLHAAHLKAMLAVTEMGGIICPPVPAFYERPATLEQMIDHTVGRVLDLFEMESGLVNRWQGRSEDPLRLVHDTARSSTAGGRQ